VLKAIRTPDRLGFAALAGALGAFTAAIPADANLVADGITYTLTESANGTTANFDLNISGINGASDTEGGRSGVAAFAFNPPTNFSGATPPPGFMFMTVGLNSKGCDGKGNFFCFGNNASPLIAPPLAANSTLSFMFTETISSGTFAGYNPDFKITWVGSQSNPPHSGYDPVSEALTPTPGPVPFPIPEPVTLALLGTALAGVGVAIRRRRNLSD
jgi:hypothetical protein